jgi:hypothetical protein
LVVGFRLAADFFADFFAAAPFADAFFFRAAFFLAAGFAPAAARLACLARARAGFFAPASAGALSANEATNATSNAITVLRIVDRSARMRLP